MTCAKQTMWKAGIGILLVAIVAFAALPEFRARILAASPLLLFLLCPLSMIFCMKMMNDKQCRKPDSEARDRASASRRGADSTRS